MTDEAIAQPSAPSEPLLHLNTHATHSSTTHLSCLHRVFIISLRIQSSHHAFPGLGCITLPSLVQHSSSRVQNFLLRHSRWYIDTLLRWKTGAIADVGIELGNTPTLQTFIPSMPPRSPFQISIHRWTKPQLSHKMAFFGGGGGGGVSPGKATWCIRVIIDGVIASYVTSASLE